MLVLALSIAIGGRTGITFKKQQLTDTFIGIDPAVSTRAVAEFKGEVTFPAGFRWCRVDNDSQARISALAQADHGDIGRNPQFFKRHSEAIGMRRKNEITTIFIFMERRGLEVGRIEPLGIHHRARYMPKD